MKKEIINFLKYNKILVILIVLFITGTGVFASEEAQNIIGTKETEETGEDNTLLMETDLDKFDMNFAIERIEEDENYYYVYYTFTDIEKVDSVWQLITKEESRRVSKKSNIDLISFIAEELKEENDFRIKELKEKKNKEQAEGEKTKTTIEKYSGIIGKVLDLGEAIIPGFEAETESIVENPLKDSLDAYTENLKQNKGSMTTTDSLAQMAIDAEDEYLSADSDFDGIINENDNCPYTKNSDQEDSDNDGVGDSCDIDNMTQEDINNTNTSNSDGNEGDDYDYGDSYVSDDDNDNLSVIVVDLDDEESSDSNDDDGTTDNNNESEGDDNTDDTEDGTDEDVEGTDSDTTEDGTEDDSNNGEESGDTNTDTSDSSDTSADDSSGEDTGSNESSDSSGSDTSTDSYDSSGESTSQSSDSGSDNTETSSDTTGE